MKKKASHVRALWLCIPGIVFLFEPNIAFADYLPNAIGYCLLLWGISRVGELFDRLQDAAQGLTKMLWISLGILFGRAVLESFMPESDQMNAFEGSTLSLIIGFVLAVMQIYYLLPALKDLFLGLEAVMERHGTRAPLPEKKGKSAGERMAGFSAFFIFSNSVLSVLPELTVLSGASYAAGKSEFDWYRFIGLFRTVAGLAAGVIGLIWLIRAIWFLLRLCRDFDLMQTVEERYALEILPRHSMLLYRRACFAFAFLIIGAVFAINVRIDQKDLFPAFLSAVLCILGILWTWEMWVELKKERLAALISGGLLLAVSAVRELLSYRYFDRYTTVEQAGYRTEAYSAYLGVRITSAAEVLTMAVFLISVICLLRAAVRRESAGDDASSSEKGFYRSVTVRANVASAAVAVAMLGNAAEALLHLQFPWLWWISLSLMLVAVALFASFVFAVREYLENRAMSEELRFSSNHTATP